MSAVASRYLSFEQLQISAIWLPSGLSLAALLLLGTAYWPGVFVGQFVSGLIFDLPFAENLLFAVGVTSGTAIAAALSRKLINFDQELKSPKDCLVLIIIGIFVVSLVSSVCAALGHVVRDHTFTIQPGQLQLVGEWWMSHAMGILVLTPVLLTAKTSYQSFASRYRALELCVLAVLVLSVGVAVFSGLTPLGVKNYPLAFLPFPLVIWAALRFGYRGAAPVTLAFGIFAIVGTRGGFGPFVHGSIFEEVILFWSFLGVAAVTGIYLSAVLAENRAIQKSQKRLIEDLDAYTQSVAHDIKDRLNSTICAASVLADESDNLSREEKREYLEILSHSGEHMLRYVDEMLIFANVEKNHVTREPLDMRQVVEEAILGLTGTIKGAEPNITFPKRWHTAVGYAPWMVFVWTSLIGNAYKYGGRPLEITIGSQAEKGDPGQIRFWISDNGSGIRPGDSGKLFQPFYRRESTNRSGNGLGLSIAARIIERLGGKIGATNDGAKGKGAKFSFTLPTA